MIASFIFIMTLSSHPCCRNLPLKQNTANSTDICPSRWRQLLDQGHTYSPRLLPANQVNRLDVQACVESIIFCLPWMIVGVNAVMDHSSIFCGCLCSEPTRIQHSAVQRLKKRLYPFACVHTMSPSIAYSCAHTDRQTHTQAAEDEGQGQVGPQRDIVVGWWPLQNKHRGWDAERKRERVENERKLSEVAAGLVVTRHWWDREAPPI